MRNPGLEEAQAGIKIAGRNINNLRYADDTTLMAESKEEPQSLFFFFSTLLFHFHQEALQFLFAFCHKGGVICISEIVCVSPSNLDSSMCFIYPSISPDVLCI